ncbi:MAG TPA: DUF2846 domain-containing protein [Pseudomonadales bacterium]
MILKKLKKLSLPVGAIVVTGCTISTPVVTTGSFESLNATDANKGEIYVYRDKAFAGSANQYDVMLNGQIVGSLPNGSFFNVAASPGENKVEPRTLTEFNFGKGSTVFVKEGEIYCFKLTLNFCMQCKSADITEVDTEQCKSEIQSLKKVKLK